jgi:Tol biopolymer transport system component
MHSVLRTLPALLFAVATAAPAAITGEVIAVHDLATGRYAVMSATNGNGFVEGPCGGDLTHGGSPRYFLSSVAGTPPLLPDGYVNSELVAADEDCAQSLVISDAPSMRFSNLPHWSPDGLKIAVYAEPFALPGGSKMESGIYIADVVRTAGRPTGIANLYLAIPTLGEVLISWSGDSQRIAYVGSAPNGSDGQQADIFVYDLGADVSVNVTNTPSVNEDHPAYSPASERIAFIRLMAVRGTYRYDIFTIPAAGGTAFQVTTKGTTGATQNLFPCFSPDGQYLSFSSGSSLFAFDIYRIRSDGSGKAVNLTGRLTGSFRYNLWRR